MGQQFILSVFAAIKSFAGFEKIHSLRLHEEFKGNDSAELLGIISISKKLFYYFRFLGDQKLDFYLNAFSLLSLSFLP